VSEFLRPGAERWQQEQDAAERGARRAADHQAAFEAHLERRITEAKAALAAFLELMAQHGNPGLRRWKITKSSSAITQKRAWLGGWRAWREAGNLSRSGRFRMDDRWVSDHEYLRRLLGARVPSAHFSHDATTAVVDDRWRAFCGMLGRLLARHEITVPEAPRSTVDDRLRARE
jgi:hypothetical protein